MSVIGSFPNIQASTAPSWSCFINGFAISSTTIPGINRNNWELCALQNISTTTPTNLTVTASGSTDTPFLLDRIEYTPIASVILDNATVLVPGNDTQVQYDSGWSNFRDLGRQTSVNGSTMTFDFIGAPRLHFHIFALIFVSLCRYSSNLVHHNPLKPKHHREFFSSVQH
jgi:hypothetical protein